MVFWKKISVAMDRFLLLFYFVYAQRVASFPQQSHHREPINLASNFQNKQSTNYWERINMAHQDLGSFNEPPSSIQTEVIINHLTLDNNKKISCQNGHSNLFLSRNETETFRIRRQFFST
ncbi:uncharacterized protein LOC143249976 [Tachypleus tridentatus]|uniref:uncharacterized protein LOC143249976 n=1 Tax=Tachypleus tridentatus TaxID=6853 RepID=UPI003FD1DB69